MVHIFDPFEIPAREMLERDAILCTDDARSNTEVVHHVRVEPVADAWVCLECGESTIYAKA